MKKKMYVVRSYGVGTGQNRYGSSMELDVFLDEKLNQYVWLHRKDCKTINAIKKYDGQAICLSFEIVDRLKNKRGEPKVYEIIRPNLKTN